MTDSILHIRCGADLAEGLARAGIPGDYLEFSDPLVQGPVPAGLGERELATLRGGWLARAYGLDADESRARLHAELDGLERALDHDRIVLWFEHDPYDQTILCRLLSHFAAHRALGKLWLIALDSHPEIDDFIGLGQLHPAQLHDLWGSEQQVTEAMLAAGKAGYAALRADTAEPMMRLMEEGAPTLPFLSGALHRLSQELPWEGSGLGLGQQIALQAVAEGIAEFGPLFVACQRRDPLPYLGDVMFWHMLTELAAARRPAITIAGDGPRARVTLTGDGQALLTGQLDWRRCGAPERFVGGIRIGDAP